MKWDHKGENQTKAFVFIVTGRLQFWKKLFFFLPKNNQLAATIIFTIIWSADIWRVKSTHHKPAEPELIS